MKNHVFAVALCVLALFAIAFVAGCATSPGGSSVPVSTVKGQIMVNVAGPDGGDLLPMTDVAVTCESTSLVLTSASSTYAYLISNLSAGKKIIKISSNNYVNTQKIVNLPAGGNEYVKVCLQQYSQGTYSPTHEVAFINGGATLEFDNNITFETSSGALYTGEVTVSFKYFDPTNTNEVSSFPGLFEGVSNGATTPFESYGFFSAKLTDVSGNPLKLRSGEDGVTMRFPIPPEYLAGAPNPIDLWSYNETNGKWEHQGFAVLQGNEYWGTITHFSYWNADKPMETTTLYGYVRDDKGNGVPSAKVRTVGIDYTGEFAVSTLASGYFSNLAVRKNSTVEVVASRGLQSTIAGKFITPASASPMDIGIITLEAGQAPPASITVTIQGTNAYNGHLTGPTTSDAVRFQVTSDPFVTSLECTSPEVKFISTYPDIVGFYSMAPGTYRFYLTAHPQESPIVVTDGIVVSFDTGKGMYTFGVPKSNPSNLNVWRVFQCTYNGTTEAFENVVPLGGIVSYEPSPYN